MQDRSRINYRKNKLFITVATVAFLFLAGCGNRADESGLTEFSAAEEPAASEHASDASVRADPGADGASAGNGSSTGENNKDKIFVYVCGAVCAPGVYELDEGARVYEAVQEAGGMSADASADSVNLARVAQDGEQIYILTCDEAQTEGTMPGTEITGENKKVNINTASAEELMTLSGIGESKAESIIRYREENGRFQKIEELMEISGIKEGVFEKIKDDIII